MKYKVLISSQDNTVFKEYKAILETSGINKYKKVLISGKKIIDDIISSGKYENPELAVHEEQFDLLKTMYTDELLHRVSIQPFSRTLFSELDIFRTKYPLLIVSLPVIKSWNLKPLKGCTVVLPFQNPVNIGSAIRSARAMGAHQVMVLKESSHPFHPKSIRSSSGTVFTTDLLLGPSMDDFLRIKDLSNLITLDMKGKDITRYSFPSDFMLMPGIEGQGIPPRFRKNGISIPMSSGVESLNAAVSVSIVLWEWKNRVKG